jgi:hypothetical protein
LWDLVLADVVEDEVGDWGFVFGVDLLESIDLFLVLDVRL